jgi:hypothetical protein
MLERPALAHIFQRTLKGQPSAAAVHTPAPAVLTEAERRRRRRQQLAGAVQKIAGAPEGTYMGRMVQNAEQWRAWWAVARDTRDTSEPAALDANLHCTVILSNAVVDTPPDASHIVIPPAQLRFGVLGPQNAVVLLLDAPVLVGRNAQLRQLGAAEDYPSHQPHVTLCYLGAGYDSTDWRDGEHPAMPDIPVVLGPELVGPLGVNVYEAAKLPTWYIGADASGAGG